MQAKDGGKIAPSPRPLADDPVNPAPAPPDGVPRRAYWSSSTRSCFSASDSVASFSRALSTFSDASSMSS